MTGRCWDRNPSVVGASGLGVIRGKPISQRWPSPHAAPVRGTGGPRTRLHPTTPAPARRRRSLPACSSGLRRVPYPRGSEEAVERGVDIGAFGFHYGPVERTDIVQVDIDEVTRTTTWASHPGAHRSNSSDCEFPLRSRAHARRLHRRTRLRLRPATPQCRASRKNTSDSASGGRYVRARGRAFRPRGPPGPTHNSRCLVRNPVP